MKGLKTTLMVGLFLVAGSAFGQCRDPWVTELVSEYKKANGSYGVIGRADLAECNYVLYGSNWSSRDQLKSQVAQTFQALRDAGLQYKGENLMTDLKFPGSIVYANQTPMAGMGANAYVGPRGNAPAGWADQAQTNGGSYWWHVPLPNNHVLIVARKCRRGWTSTGPTGGCVR